MNFSKVIVIAFLLLSCNDEKNKSADTKYHKLISKFLPAFEEASEVTFVDSLSSKHLSILIRKNYRLDETEYTFYFKIIALDEMKSNLVHNTLLNGLDSSVNQKKDGMRDGIGIFYEHIVNHDTMHYSIQSPSYGTKGYEVTATTFDLYQYLFRDTIISDYFNELQTYINNEEYVVTRKMTALKLLREKKYAGLMKYSR